jgi:hypothetical protein
VSANSLGRFCRRIVRAYRQHFPVQGGGGWMEADTMYFSFDHPQCTLLLGLTPSNPKLGKRLTVNLSSFDNELSLSVDSMGIKWNALAPNSFTPEELDNFENLASRVYLIALDSVEQLRLLTSLTG